MKKRVLIFDDDQDILAICSFILQSGGFVVTTEENCGDLLNKVTRAQPDLIIMDNKIPNDGGIKSTNLIKQSDSFRHIPVIFFSANSDVKNLADEAHADFYIEKPFDADELVSMANRATAVN